MTAPVRAVIFDFGGVIVPGHGPGSFWEQLEREHGLEPGALFQALYLQNPVWLRLRVGDGTHEEWHAATYESLAAIASEDVARAVLDVLQQPRPVEFNPGMIELVRGLRGRARVGLLSNAAPGLEEELRDHYRIDDLFDDVINSATVRLAKPDERIFQLAAKRLGLEPAECFFTDDLEHNVEAARAAGMRAERFERADALVAALRREGLVLG